ncbi:MAG: hypothetical protein WBW46_18805 [Candidatus Sulfotelmatobacter sp.]|jgi:hypothetical protein
MSEERRKRHQERVDAQEAKPASRKNLIWVGIVLLFVVAYAAGWEYKNHRYDGFAKCLASKQVKMYGLYWCPHCIEQKEMFGKAFQYVPYVECAVKGSHDITAQCKAAGVKLFPSWQFGTNPPVPSVFPLDVLSAQTGCSLP